MEKIKVSDLCDVVINLHTAKTEIANGTETKEIKIGMIKSKTLIEYSDETVRYDPDRMFTVKKNDIIIKRVNPVFVTLVSEDRGAVLGANLVCIRIKEKYKEKIMPEFLAAYLDAKIRTYMREDAAIPLLVAQKLRDLYIPLTDIEKQKAIGLSWFYNSINYEKNKALLETEYEYNQNLILKNLEEINGH